MFPWHLVPRGVPQGEEGTRFGYKCNVGGEEGGHWVWKEVGEGLWWASLLLTAASHVPQIPLLCWRPRGAWRTGCSSSSASSLNLLT